MGSSSKKNRVNVLEFESGKNFMTGKTLEDMNTRNTKFNNNKDLKIE
jgi:hypothetical protein